MHRAMFQRFTAILTICSLAGCGADEEGAPELNPVTGKLTINGQAVPDVQIAFVPAGGDGRAATGNTDAQGQYTLASPNAGLGAVAGKYKVVLTPSARGDSADMRSQYSAAKGDPTKAAAEESTIPKEFLSASTSTKIVEVIAGENTINIEL